MDEVYNFLLTELQLSCNSAVIAAISGGPDSMLLLKILQDLKSKINIKIIVAHVNHNLREESQQEKEDLGIYCKKYKLIFEYHEIPKRENRPLTEAEAREIRYDFFDRLAKKYKASYVFTAHHGDDLIETIMMRIVRGSSLRGYSGFRRITEKDGYKIVRPLLTITKDEIVKYLDEVGIKYALDKSNDSMDYTRNRYRKNVLPFLKEEDKNVHLKFKKFSETISLYDDYIKKEVLKQKDQVVVGNAIKLDLFNKLDLVIKVELLYLILNDIYNEGKSFITEKHIESILGIIENKRPNISIMLPRNICAIKEYDLLYFKENEEMAQYNIKLDKKTKLPNNKNIEFVDSVDNNSNYVTRLNSKEIKMPLYARTKLSNDYMIVKGINKNKKVKDIFINDKIPVSIRKTTPVVVDSNNTIVWLPGIKKSSFDKNENEEYDIILHYF